MNKLLKIFKRLFGKKNRKPSTREAIQNIRETEELLAKKQEYLEQKINEQLEIASKFANKDNRQALIALKRKKRLEQHLQSIDGTLTTLEYQRENLENSHTTKEIIQVMSVASRASKFAHNIDPDEIHDMMDEVCEQRELSKELTNLVSNVFGIVNQYDENELLDELNEVEDSREKHQANVIQHGNDICKNEIDSPRKISTWAS